MKRSTDRILTTHAGSLPRPQALIDSVGSGTNYGRGEASIATLGQQWREYTIEWRVNGARFLVDGALVLETDRPPRGPLGFVAWVDNQWMVATPHGRFGWGLLQADAHWLDLALVRIEPF